MRPNASSRSPSNGPLVTATFSNKRAKSRSRTKSRGRTRDGSRTPPTPIEKSNKVALEGNWELDVICSRSESDGPDDIIDMQERYSGPALHGMVPFSLARSMARAQEALEGPKESREDVEESFHGETFLETREEYNSYSEVESIHKHESYIEQVLQKFQIKDVLAGLQGSSASQLLGSHQEIAPTSNKISVTNKAEELEAKLKHESQRAEQLEKKLAGTERSHELHKTEYCNKILALESKLAMQERIFASQLRVEKHKARQNFGYSASADSPSRDNARIRSLTETVESLQGEITKLQAANTTLKASLDERQAHFDTSMGNAKARVRGLERKCSEVEQQLHVQTTRGTEKEEQFKMDERKKKELELSLEQAQTLLAAERKRVETLTKLNDRMKTAMRKLSKKAMGHENMIGEVEELQRQLQSRDAQIAIIKSILNHRSDEVLPSNLGSENLSSKLREAIKVTAFDSAEFSTS